MDSKPSLHTVQSQAHYNKIVKYELSLEDGPIDNREPFQRPVKKGSIVHGLKEEFSCSDFPVLSFEEDGPVGSYLTWRYLNNIVLLGSFAFFVKENSGSITFHQRRSMQDNVSNNVPPISDELLSHEVYVIPESVVEISFSDLGNLPRLYFGKAPYLPNGQMLFPTEESYREAFSILHQDGSYSNNWFKKIGTDTLEARNNDVDEVFGAARVYVDGYGWRFLIPNKNGVEKAIEVLKSSTHRDDLEWIKSQNGKLTDYQKGMLKDHFGELFE